MARDITNFHTEDTRALEEATMARNKPMAITDLQLLAQRSPQVSKIPTDITKTKEQPKMARREEKMVKEKRKQIKLKLQKRSQ